MSDPQQRVTCPGCEKGYRWQASLIGRRVPCKQCGTEFRVPEMPGVGIAINPDPISEDSTYDLDLDAAADTPASPEHHAVPAKGGKCPSCNSPVREGAMLCLNCGFNMAEGKKIQAPEVTPLPKEEKKAMRRELAGMKWVRVGLWLNLISILLLFAIVPLPIAAGLAGLDFILVIDIIAYASIACSTLGALLCLTAPKESKARPILIVSMALSIASIVMSVMIDMGDLSYDYDWISEVIGTLANVFFLYFFVQLAKYLEFDQITERARLVLGYYIALQLSMFLLVLPIIGCITLILMLIAAVYTLFLYIGLLIDLNNALTYHIQEQSV